MGISSRRGNVWVRFTDDRSLELENNLQPGANATGVAPPAPVSTRARALGARPRALAKRLSTGQDRPALLVQGQFRQFRSFRQFDMFGTVPSNSGPDAVHLCQDWVDASTLALAAPDGRGPRLHAAGKPR